MKKTKQPIDYSKGKIYKIWSFNSPEIYIGSTIQDLSERLRGHLRSFNHYKKTGKRYRVSFIILENEHYDIELIEYCPCKTKLELCRREGELQREMECVNKQIAGRTKKEYLEDNKEIIAKQHKNYYEDNKEIIKEKNREWKKKNEGYQQKYYKENEKELKEKSKIYREKNKEPIAIKCKKYKKKNKEKIKEYEKEILKIRVICECGQDIMKKTKARHIKTEKHIRLMEEKKKYIKIKILKNPTGC